MPLSFEKMIRQVRQDLELPGYLNTRLVESKILDILEAHLTEEHATHAILAADLDAVIALLDRPQPFEAMRPLISRLAQCLKRALDVPQTPLPYEKPEARRCDCGHDAFWHTHVDSPSTMFPCTAVGCDCTGWFPHTHPPEEEESPPCRHCGRRRDAHYYGHDVYRPCVVETDSTTYAPAPDIPSFAPVMDALVALQAQLAHRDTALAEVVAAAQRVAQHYTHPSDAPRYLDVDLEALAHALAVWDATKDTRQGEE